VLAVVSDKTKSVCVADTVQYFTAEVLNAYDYSPFGAIIPHLLLLNTNDKDRKDGAYTYDYNFFNNLANNSNGSFVAIEAKDLVSVALLLKDYCDKNVCTISNLIIDFHGYPSNFAIGEDHINESNIFDHEKDFKTIGAFMNASSNVLMGNCNIAKYHMPCLSIMSDFFNNASVFGHMTYCMSCNLDAGVFHNSICQYIEYPDSDTENAGKYKKINGCDQTRDVENVSFKTKGLNIGQITHE
jgi:hypothetical protein